ncbi:hypothetical protein [Shinella oryzae]|uniref:hypothetical protein n=1 Tax=Shinella TaxID=323620 RepID=UPI001FF19807|nr:hypothetical protein [Shinella oryzae]UPA27733.1 hypothetical protein K6301_19555 [Shinella oryzae]
MASPWNILARLVSPRRQQRQEDDPVEKPNVPAIADSTEKPAAVDQPDGPSTARSQPEDAAGGTVSDGTVENDNADVPKDVGSSFADVSPNKTRKPNKARNTAKPASAKRKGRAGNVEPPAAAAQPPQVPPTVSEQMTSLDEEIRTFREQLASKLRLQNAQLRTMLERYER